MVKGIHNFSKIGISFSLFNKFFLHNQIGKIGNTETFSAHNSAKLSFPIAKAEIGKLGSIC